MKYKNEIVIISIITILILFLKLINVFQIENGLGYPFTIVLMIICFSLVTIFIQKNIDKNYRINKLNYQNLNILKYTDRNKITSAGIIKGNALIIISFEVVGIFIFLAFFDNSPT